jgi:hypothetical protein
MVIEHSMLVTRAKHPLIGFPQLDLVQLSCLEHAGDTECESA